MVNLFNNSNNAFDALFNNVGTFAQNSTQGNNRNSNRNDIQVKELNKSNQHEIQVFNRSGYQNFKIEVVRQGGQFYLQIQSKVDRFERYFKLNTATEDTNNIKSYIENDWLIVAVPFINKGTRSPQPKNVPEHPSKKQDKKQDKEQKQQQQQKQQKPQKESKSARVKKIFGKKKNDSNHPVSLLEAARRKPFLEEVPDPGI